jgi:hypothetical protein
LLSLADEAPLRQLRGLLNGKWQRSAEGVTSRFARIS